MLTQLTLLASNATAAAALFIAFLIRSLGQVVMVRLIRVNISKHCHINLSFLGALNCRLKENKNIRT